MNNIVKKYKIKNNINLDITLDSISIPSNEVTCCFCSNDQPRFYVPHRKENIPHHFIFFHVNK